MRQFLLPRECDDGSNLRLEGDDFHYLCRVLRRDVGDQFVAISPQGERFTATLEEIGDGSCTIRVQRRETAAAAFSSGARKEAGGGEAWLPELTLVQCLPKGKVFDEIVRQATQTGVRRVVPALSERSVPRFDSMNEANKKRERWQRVAREAVQQSGASGVPEIVSPITLSSILTGDDSELLPNASDSLWLFFHERKLQDRTLHGYLESCPRKIVLFIGPEGGFSDGERRSLLSCDAAPVYLGPRVLRAETAALFAIAAIQILMMESDSWVK